VGLTLARSEWVLDGWQLRLFQGTQIITGQYSPKKRRSYVRGNEKEGIRSSGKPTETHSAYDCRLMTIISRCFFGFPFQTFFNLGFARFADGF